MMTCQKNSMLSRTTFWGPNNRHACWTPHGRWKSWATRPEFAAWRFQGRQQSGCPAGPDPMAEIVAAFASSHSVMLAATREDWIANFRKTDPGMPLVDRHGIRRSYDELLAQAPPKAEELVTPGRISDAFDRTVAAVNALKQQIKRVPLDVLLVIGDDQHELFQDAMMPSLAIYYGETIRNAA